MIRDHSRPPRILRRLLRSCLPAEDREALARELDELYGERRSVHGPSSANAWYARQVAGFVARVGVERLPGASGSADAAWRDLKVAARSLRRAPAFSFAFMLTLAIGVGVLATVYTAARWVLLRPVPGVRDPSSLVTLRLGSAEAPAYLSWSISNPDLAVLRERLPVRGAVAAITPADVDVRAGADDRPQRVAGAMVTSNYFSVLGAPLIAGRPFVFDEDAPGAAVPTVVLSYDLARRIAGTADSAPGRDVRINGTSVRVIGVTTPGFRGDELPGRAELWLPLSALPIIDPSVERDATIRRDYQLWRRTIIRVPSSVAPDTRVSLIASSSNTVMAQTPNWYNPDRFQYQVFAGVGLDPSVRATVQRTLILLGAAALFLLTLAAANLANLAFVRSARRSRGTAIRFAIGAGRATLARSILAEAAVLAVGASILSLALAVVWSHWFAGRQLSEHGGALAGMHVGARVVVATIVVALLTAIIAFARPAWSPRFRSLDALMRGEAVGGRRGRRSQSVLLSVQVALSFMLLVAAGLLGRTVRNLRQVDLGFLPDHLLMFSLDPHLHGIESAALGRLGRELERDLAAKPGIRAAGFVSPTPLASSYVTSALYSSPVPDVRPVIGAGFYVTPGFLDVIGVRVLAGDAHWSGDSGTAVISRTAWEKVAPGRSPQAAIGVMIPTRPAGRAPIRVAAVIEDLKLSDILNVAPPLVFRPLAERLPGMSMSGFVATTTRPASQATAVLRTMAASAPELPVFDVRPARAAVDLQFAERAAMALAAATFGAIGVLLAAIGVYGVLAHVVATRRREIGIRSALGARPSRIVSDIVGGGMAPVAAGVLAGLAGAAMVSRVLAAQLFGLGRFDGATYWGGLAILLAAALAACLAPAWRATHVAPAEVLRAE